MDEPAACDCIYQTERNWGSRKWLPLNGALSSA